MGYTNMDWVKMSDTAIVEQLGKFIKHTRIKQNITQSQLAETAGLNRWTIGQIENGESIINEINEVVKNWSDFASKARVRDDLYKMIRSNHNTIKSGKDFDKQTSCMCREIL